MKKQQEEKLKKKKHNSVGEYRKQLHQLPLPASMKFNLMTTKWNNQTLKYIQYLLE